VCAYLIIITFLLKLSLFCLKCSQELEKEYSTKLFNELDNIKTIEMYKLFEEKNLHLINALFPKNKTKIIEIKNRLEKSKKLKKWSGVTLSLIVVGVVVVGIIALNAKTLLVKNESELFTDITMEYKTNDYEKALEDIKSYQTTYPKTVNLEHKQKIIEIKSNIEKAQIISNAKKIIEDTTFDNIDEIEEIFSSFSEMGINKPELLSKLHTLKNKLSLNSSYMDFQNNLKNKNFGEALIYIEQNWKKSFGKDNQQTIIKVLNIKFNNEVEKLLKDISPISDIDEFNNLVKKINKINALQSQTSMTKFPYKAILNSDNNYILNEKRKIQKNYESLLDIGVSRVKVIFGANSEENEPLGFKCDKINGDILLSIDSKKYYYKNGASCNNLKISWNDSSTHFKAVRYSIKVIEENVASFFNDEYNSDFTLNENDLIKIYNHKNVKKDIGHSYFIEIQK